MTFRQLQANVKLRRTLMTSSIIIIGMGLAIFAFLMTHFSFTTTSLMIGAIAYAMSMGGSLAILYSLNYNKTHTKCIKCRRQIDIADFMAMENFKCPHCGHECDADAPLK